MATKEALIAHFESSGRKVVWLNKDGDWMNRPHKDFPIETKREDVLKQESKTKNKSKDEKDS